MTVFQFAIQYPCKHDQIQRCTKSGDKLTPVPKGFEVFGATVAGVNVLGVMTEIKTGDWLVETPRGFAVMSDQTYRFLAG